MNSIAVGIGERIAKLGSSIPENELLRYFLASGFALGVDYGTLLLLTEVVGLHYLVSAAIGFMLGLVSVYLLSIHWVFTTRRVQKSHHEALIFAIIGFGGLGINELGLYLLTEALMLHYAVSKLLVTGLVFGWNFGIRKILLFR
ncbi:MAG: GtrA family protein [Gammaproteobacteria bacterium]|nr:GtrA family protein [Gammaproteobacteria bacterium]